MFGLLDQPLQRPDFIQSGNERKHYPRFAVRRCSQNSAKLNQKDKNGWTPLTVAEGIYNGGVFNQAPDIIELLRKAGAEPSPANIERDGTAISAAARQ